MEIHRFIYDVSEFEFIALKKFTFSSFFVSDEYSIRFPYHLISIYSNRSNNSRNVVTDPNYILKPSPIGRPTMASSTSRKRYVSLISHLGAKNLFNKTSQCISVCTLIIRWFHSSENQKIHTKLETKTYLPFM